MRACALSAAALTLSLVIPPYPVEEFDAVRSAWRASDAWLLDRNGVPLSRVRIDHERRRGVWVAIGDVSPPLTALVIESEDRRFRDHRGVDWLAVPAALRQTIAGERRGGSTLSMQLAAYLNPELERGGHRNLIDKWRQVRQAIAIERRWSKDEVIEAWLNLTPFRGELEGIDAASRSLFDKTPAGLDRVESALLAAMVRAPNAAASRIARRACLLLQPTGQQHAVRGDNGPSPDPSPTPGSGVTDRYPEESACLAARGYAAGGLRPRGVHSALDGSAPHLARKLLKRAGHEVRSSLDGKLQSFAVATLTRHLRELEGRHVEDGALVVLDNASGEVLAWVGSSGSLSRAHEVDGVLSPRQPGSTLKPFLYALAIEQTVLTAASILDDTPLAVTLPTGLYVPQNYDRTFKGQVSLRQALAASLNVPAVRTLALLGYEPFHRKLEAAGIDFERDADHYGYSLALGGGEVTLLDLTNAYRTLANGGRVSPVRPEPFVSAVRPFVLSPSTPPFPVRPEPFDSAVRPFVLSPSTPPFPVRPERSAAESKDRTATLRMNSAPQSRRMNGYAQDELRAAESKDEQPQAIDPRAAYIVSDILADPAARALTFGLASALSTRYRASVKTGTSKDMRDNWTVGYTTRYTVGVWVGNFSGAPMHDVSGIHGAAPVWREIMDYLHQGSVPEPAIIPEGITQQRVAYKNAIEPPREEWFIAGTEVTTISPVAARAVTPRIETPANGAIYAIDPDIPRDRQRLVVTARAAPRGAKLVLEDGRALRADRPALWLPDPGRRVVILRAADGTELDRVGFEVRGLRRVTPTSSRNRRSN